MNWTNEVTSLFGDYMAPILSFLVGVILYVLAPRLLGPGSNADRIEIQATIFRFVIVAFMALQIVDIILHKALLPDYNRILLRASVSLAMLYGAIFGYNVLARLLEAKFGKSREIDGTTVPVASYHSRMATVIAVVVLVLIGIIALIKVWGLDSVLESTGFIGIVAAFIFLTNAVWFPDIYFGMTLLASSMADEGDTIKLNGLKPHYIINRLTPFYALLLNVETNERVILRNSKLFEGPIENLNKRASIEGLRRRIDLNISYPKNEKDAAARAELFDKFELAVNTAFEEVLKDADIKINPNAPPTWFLAESEDFALRFSVFFHLAPLPETKLTKTVRHHLLWTPAAVARALYNACSERGLYLATPKLVQVSGGLAGEKFVNEKGAGFSKP